MTSRKAAPSQQLFDGPGRSRQLARSVDWGAAGLGAVDEWPVDLKVTTRLCLEAPGPAVLWVGPELRLLYNDAYWPLLGARSESAMGRPLAEVWPNLVDTLGAEIRQVRQDGVAMRHQDTQFQLRRNERDDTGYFTYSLTPVRDRHGDVASVFCTIEETTGNVRARARSEERYRSLFNSIDEGFCIIEVEYDGQTPVDYRFLKTNPAFEKQTGLQDVVGRSMRALAPDHEQHWFDIYGRVARTGEPIRFQQPAEALGHFYDVYAFRLGEPELNQVAVLFNDISAQKRAEERLRQANRRKDEYLAMLGHELRNPLAAIQHASEIIKLAPGDSSMFDRALGVLERQSTQMAGLVDGLLEVSRIARGKIKLSRTRADLRALVDGVIADRGHAAMERDLELHKSLPDEPVWAQVDRLRLSQVVDNLVGNALKFTNAPGSVSVSLRQIDEQAEIIVQDTGVGVAAEQLSQIFEPFHQQEQDVARSAGGLGLGLAVAKELVELHGGTIEARSEGIGRGSEFVVCLPVVPPQTRPEGASS